MPTFHLAAPRTTEEAIVRLLYSSVVPVLLNATAQVTVALLLARHDNAALQWLGVLGATVGVSRLSLMAAFHRTYDGSHTWRWEVAYGVGSIVFAAVIGATVATAFLTGDSVAHMLAVGLFYTHAVAVVSRSAVSPWICRSSLFVSFIPSAISIVAHWDPAYFGLAMLTLMMLIGSMETVRHVSSVARHEVERGRTFARLAHSDRLTGLPNRLTLDERLRESLLERQRGQLVAVHFIDLDHFKAANDQYGHALGDALLTAVGKRLHNLMRSSDFASRFGGDEFVVVQTNVVHGSEIELLARRIVRALSEPFSIDGHEVVIGASVGVAIAPDDGLDANTLLEKADAALYRVKREQRGTVALAGAAGG